MSQRTPAVEVTVYVSIGIQANVPNIYRIEILSRKITMSSGTSDEEQTLFQFNLLHPSGCRYNSGKIVPIGAVTDVACSETAFSGQRIITFLPLFNAHWKAVRRIIGLLSDFKSALITQSIKSSTDWVYEYGKMFYSFCLYCIIATEGTVLDACSLYCKQLGD